MADGAVRAAVDPDDRTVVAVPRPIAKSVCPAGQRLRMDYYRALTALDQASFLAAKRIPSIESRLSFATVTEARRAARRAQQDLEQHAADHGCEAAWIHSLEPFSKNNQEF